MGLLIAAGTVALVSVTWGHYLVLIPREKVPRRPWAHAGVMVGSMAVAVVAFSVWPGWVAAILGLFTLGLAGFFVWLLTLAAIPTPELPFSVGDRLVALEARTPGGGVWSSEAISGRRTLLKVFRGHW